MLISTNDLSAFALPVQREPLWVSYRGLRAVSVPPPGGGVQLFLALKVLEQLLPSDNALDSAAWYEAIALATYAGWRGSTRVLPSRPLSAVCQLTVTGTLSL